MVDTNARPPQRLSYLEANRELIFALRVERLRMGSCPQRLRGRPGFLMDVGFKREHDPQGIESGELRHPSVLTGAKGKRVPLHEGNHSVIGVLTHLIPKSSTMMCELRKLFFLIDTYDIKIRTLYIQSATHTRADNLTWITDTSDWQLAPRDFRLLSKLWGSHTVGRFASNANKQLHRYYAKWGDGTSETLDCLRLPD